MFPGTSPSPDGAALDAQAASHDAPPAASELAEPSDARPLPGSPTEVGLPPYPEIEADAPSPLAFAPAPDLPGPVAPPVPSAQPILDFQPVPIMNLGPIVPAPVRVPPTEGPWGPDEGAPAAPRPTEVGTDVGAAIGGYGPPAVLPPQPLAAQPPPAPVVPYAQPPQPRRSGGAVWIAVGLLALILVGGGTGAALWMRSRAASADETEAPTIDLPSAVHVAEEPPAAPPPPARPNPVLPGAAPVPPAGAGAATVPTGTRLTPATGATTGGGPAPGTAATTGGGTTPATGTPPASKPTGAGATTSPAPPAATAAPSAPGSAKPGAKPRIPPRR
jgi:hypothetical protein